MYAYGTSLTESTAASKGTGSGDIFNGPRSGSVGSCKASHSTSIKLIGKKLPGGEWRVDPDAVESMLEISEPG